MRKITALILAINFFYLIPCRIKAQDSPGEWQQMSENLRNIQVIYQIVEPQVNSFNDHLSRVHNVQIDVKNFESQFKRLYPKSYKYIRERFNRDRGIVNTAVPALTSTGQPFAVEAVLGLLLAYLGLVFTEAQLILYLDDKREGYCREELMAGGTMTSLQADKECNYQSDLQFGLRVEIATLIPIPGAVPAVYLAQLWEWLSEPGRRYPIEVYLFGRRRMEGRRPLNQFKPRGGSSGGGGCGFQGSVYTVTGDWVPNLPPNFVGPPGPNDWRYVENFKLTDAGCDGVFGTSR